jgi:benzil reductase ((S)-benzoin forming)
MVSENKIAFVTGVSTGIGKAIALELLQNDYLVYGIGRTNTINNPNYQFISLDFRKSELVSYFRFPQQPAQSYLLINNAGAIGEILPVGELNSESIIDVMHVNTIAPQILINTFIQTFARQNAPMHVLTISSGAAKRPIDAWATYCASKAAIDIFSETVKLEMELRGFKNFYIHSIAPGVVDTNMQTKIREAAPEKFKSSQRFHDLKNNGELASPEFVATKLMSVIKAPQSIPATILPLSEI